MSVEELCRFHIDLEKSRGLVDQKKFFSRLLTKSYADRAHSLWAVANTLNFVFQDALLRATSVQGEDREIQLGLVKAALESQRRRLILLKEAAAAQVPLSKIDPNRIQDSDYRFQLADDGHLATADLIGEVSIFSLALFVAITVGWAGYARWVGKWIIELYDLGARAESHGDLFSLANGVSQTLNGERLESLAARMDFGSYEDLARGLPDEQALAEAVNRLLDDHVSEAREALFADYAPPNDPYSLAAFSLWPVHILSILKLTQGDRGSAAAFKHELLGVLPSISLDADVPPDYADILGQADDKVSDLGVQIDDPTELY